MIIWKFLLLLSILSSVAVSNHDISLEAKCNESYCGSIARLSIPSSEQRQQEHNWNNWEKFAKLRILAFSFNADSKYTFTENSLLLHSIRKKAESSNAQVLVIAIQSIAMSAFDRQKIFSWKGWDLHFSSATLERNYDDFCQHVIILRRSAMSHGDLDFQVQVLGGAIGARCFAKGMQYESRGIAGVVLRIQRKAHGEDVMGADQNVEDSIRYLLVLAAHLPPSNQKGPSMALRCLNQGFTMLLERATAIVTKDVLDLFVNMEMQGMQKANKKSSQNTMMSRFHHFFDVFSAKIDDFRSRKQLRARCLAGQEIGNQTRCHEFVGKKHDMISGYLLLGDFNAYSHCKEAREDGSCAVWSDVLQESIVDGRLNFSKAFGWAEAGAVQEGVADVGSAFSRGPEFPPTCHARRGRDVKCIEEYMTASSALGLPGCPHGKKAIDRSDAEPVGHEDAGEDDRCHGPMMHCILRGGALRLTFFLLGMITSGPFFVGFGIPLLYPTNPSGGILYGSHSDKVEESLRKTRRDRLPQHSACCFEDKPRGWCDRIMYGFDGKSMRYRWKEYARIDTEDAGRSEHAAVLGLVDLSFP